MRGRGGVNKGRATWALQNSETKAGVLSAKRELKQLQRRNRPHVSTRIPFLSSCLTGAHCVQSLGLYSHRRMPLLLLPDGPNDLTLEEIF